MGYIKTPAEAV